MVQPLSSEPAGQTTSGEKLDPPNPGAIKSALVELKADAAEAAYLVAVAPVLNVMNVLFGDAELGDKTMGNEAAAEVGNAIRQDAGLPPEGPPKAGK